MILTCVAMSANLLCRNESADADALLTPPPHPPAGDRWSASQYLAHWPGAGQLFPPFLREGLHPFLHSLHRWACVQRSKL